MKISSDHLKRDSNNFDLIRVIAASLVILGHSPILLLNKPLRFDPILNLLGIEIHYFGVIIFFIISGYLVTKSYERCKNFMDFILARVLRIFPALICVVLLSVFVLGILLTNYSVRDYLSSKVTLHYLQDISLYRMYYYLPGVFETNPVSSINGSLWTLPYEFTCYLFLALIGIIRILKNKWFSLALLIILTGTYLLFNKKIDTIVIPIIGIDLKHFSSLLLYFLSGSVFYQFRNLISFNIIGSLICLVSIILIKTNYFFDLLLVFVLPYMILFFAFYKKIKLNKLEKTGDISYGMYLYAFPIQQLIVYFLSATINEWLMIILSFVFTIPVAILSWRYLEKPSLELRHKFNFDLKNRFNN